MSTPGGQAPLYDPATHTRPATVVYTELVCACGAIRRQRDPVAVQVPFLRAWLAAHAGDGHGPASKSDAVAERERRKRAAMEAAGIGDQYAPKDYANLDTTSTAVIPWPELPDEPPPGAYLGSPFAAVIAGEG